MSSMAPVALSTAKVSTVGRHVLSAGHCCPDRTLLSCFHIYRGARGLLHWLHAVSGKEKAVDLRFTEVEEGLWQEVRAFLKRELPTEKQTEGRWDTEGSEEAWSYAGQEKKLAATGWLTMA